MLGRNFSIIAPCPLELDFNTPPLEGESSVAIGKYVCDNLTYPLRAKRFPFNGFALRFKISLNCHE